MNSDYEEGTLLDSDEEATQPREENERDKNGPGPKVAKDVNKIGQLEKAIKTSKRGKVWRNFAFDRVALSLDLGISLKRLTTVENQRIKLLGT